MQKYTERYSDLGVAGTETWGSKVVSCAGSSWIQTALNSVTINRKKRGEAAEDKQ